MYDFSSNYFELFGLPVDFRVDRAALAERYRELQRVVHPDRYASAGDQERRLSLQWATHVNQAYETLKDPLARGTYLLTLHQVDLGNAQQTTRDAAFLMEQMELREELAEVRGQPDPLAALDDLNGRLRGLIDAREEQLAEQFAAGGAEQLQAARESVGKLQFLYKLRTEADALEAELEDLD